MEQKKKHIIKFFSTVEEYISNVMPLKFEQDKSKRICANIRGL